jgi:hypothetical protein
MGSVPIPMIATGTAEQVKAYCKDLIACRGKGAGYFVATATQIDDGREETIRAMVGLTRVYGVYPSTTEKGEHARRAV